MKKLVIILGGVAVVVLAVVVIGSFFLGSIVRVGVDKFGPSITKTKVELASASISPLTGSGTIKGLRIDNPAGWSPGQAIYLGEAHLSMQPFSLLGDHVVINDILIDQPKFVYETKIFSSNLKDLLKNIEAATGGGKEAARTPETKSGRPIKFEVKRFRLQHGKVTIGAGPAAVTVPLPPLTLTDLGTKEGGITADQLAGAVMKRVLSHVLLTAADAVGNVGKAAGSAAADATTNAAKKATESLKHLFDRK